MDCLLPCPLSSVVIRGGPFNCAIIDGGGGMVVRNRVFSVVVPPQLWNLLAIELRMVVFLETFRWSLKTFKNSEWHLIADNDAF